MNKAKWENSDVPMVKLAAKLAEETGETVQEILNADEAAVIRPGMLQRIEVEAQHAIFIATVIFNRAHEQRQRLYNERRK